jgi:hypothetical protein
VFLEVGDVFNNVLEIRLERSFRPVLPNVFVVWIVVADLTVEVFWVVGTNLPAKEINKDATLNTVFSEFWLYRHSPEWDYEKKKPPHETGCPDCLRFQQQNR